MMATLSFAAFSSKVRSASGVTRSTMPAGARRSACSRVSLNSRRICANWCTSVISFQASWNSLRSISASGFSAAFGAAASTFSCALCSRRAECGHQLVEHGHARFAAHIQFMDGIALGIEKLQAARQLAVAAGLGHGKRIFPVFKVKAQVDRAAQVAAGDIALARFFLGILFRIGLLRTCRRPA